MKKYFYLLCILVALSIACRQKEPEQKSLVQTASKQIVNDDEIYKFLNNIHHNEGIHCENLAEGNLFPGPTIKVDSLMLIGIDTLFTKKDIAYMLKQLKYSDNFRWQQTKFNFKVNLLSIKSLQEMHKPDGRFNWEDFRKKYSSNLCEIKMPLFSLDRSKAIVQTGYYCGGLCGQGGTYIYRKIGNRWIKVATIDDWIS